jgi:superfamily II DNA or RNA helicase
MQKALCCSEVSFRSDEQKEALEIIVRGEQTTPLVVVLPTGGGKTLLFTAPACLDDPGVTIVIVPYRALLDNLLATAKRANINHIEYAPGERNPAALVFVSADIAGSSEFLSYAQLLSVKGVLRRVFVDECHLTFTASDWRPKLAGIRAVRGLKVPVIMLTATLPVLLEFELEQSMAAQMARYIRADTTRTKTRYIINTCKPRKLEERVSELCKRAKKHLGLQKGVIYSRSRVQCERLAAELRCAYYHAGAVDNKERLKAWLERGGLMVATSALGTGVDFPGIVFTLHVDIPYSMIDFSQESGRAGRAGENCDSVILVEEGKAERLLASAQVRGVDQSVMYDFITTGCCRRRVMGLYLDGKEIECGGDTSLARCDRCGEGTTALERMYAQAARERQIVEETLDELRDGCVRCFVSSMDDSSVDWCHSPAECSRAGWKVQKDLDLRFRRLIKFDERSHTCFKCGLSQKLCNTGVDESKACQWPDITAPLLRGMLSTNYGRTVAKNTGLEEEKVQGGEVAAWLGAKHRGRVWGEMMSNASALTINLIVQKATAKRLAGTESLRRLPPTEGEKDVLDTPIEGQTDVGIEQGPASETECFVVPGSSWKQSEAPKRHRGRAGKAGTANPKVTLREQGKGRTIAETADAVVSEVAATWEHGCAICQAKGRRVHDGHLWQECGFDDMEALREGIRLLSSIQAPLRKQGFRCWARGISCRCRIEGKQGGCSGHKIVQVALAALLFTKREASEWVEEQKAFRESIEEDESVNKALQQVFSKKGIYEGQEWMGADKFLTMWAL